MKIGIDARLYGPKHTGIGRYTKNLIKELLKIDQKNNYILFGNPSELLPLAKYPNVNIVGLKTRVYSIKEQIINPIIFNKAKLDLLHVPHFNAPLLYRKKTVITVHDLIKHLSTGPETTTLPSWQYRFKHIAYKFLINNKLASSQSIITPSHYWKNYLTQNLNIPASKITVTYEAVDSKFTRIKKIDPKVIKKYNLKKPFIIYTGNLYPHKNVGTLVKAVKQYNKNNTHKLTLAIIAGRSEFHNKITPSEHINMLGFVEDTDFPQLYAQAISLVQPSLIEGFGLIGLEAMKLGLPVISSNSTCLPEIYGDAALYFDPYSVDDLEEKLTWIIKEDSLRTKLIKEGIKREESFSWRQTAEKTLRVYNQLS